MVRSPQVPLLHPGRRRRPAARLSPRFARLVALGALVSCAACAACEPRVEEPPPSRPARSAPLGAPEGEAARRAGPDDAGRCVEPTGEAPERPILRDGGADPACPPDPETPPKLETGKVIFAEAKAGGEPAVTVEIARKDEHRQRGLMYRKRMPEDRGMIFVFEERADHRFWMHNTCIQLDMLFIDDDGTIVGIEENTPTMNDGTFSVGCPSRYVLELNAGWARRHGVKAGQKVRLEGI